MQKLVFIKSKHFFQLLISVVFIASISYSAEGKSDASGRQTTLSNFGKEKDFTCEEVANRYIYIINKSGHIGRKVKYKKFFTPKLINKAVVKTIFRNFNYREIFFTEKEIEKLTLERKANLVKDLLVQDCNWYDSVFDLYSQKANRLNLWINRKTLSGDLPFILQNLSNKMNKTLIDKLERKPDKNWLDMTLSEAALSPNFPQDILKDIKTASQFQILKLIYIDYKRKKVKLTKYPYKKYTDKVLLNESILFYKESLFVKLNKAKKNKYHTYLSVLVSSLDAHSHYTHLTKETENDFKNNISSAGLGVRVHCFKEACLVEKISKKGAAFGKLQVGDLIVSANSIVKKGLSERAFFSHFKGEKDSLVNVQILRLVDKAEQALNISIKRGLIQAERFQVKLLKNKTAYIRLASFYAASNGFNSSSKDFINALIDLDPKAESLIIDLRNNPGGVLDEFSKIFAALALTSKFATIVENKWSCGEDVHSLRYRDELLPTGEVVIQPKGKKLLYLMPTVTYFKVADSKPKVEYYCNQRPYFLNKPIAVLINKGSGSGSEQLSLGLKEFGSAAVLINKGSGSGSEQLSLGLKEFGSALILGDKFSFGKGSGQDVLNNGSLSLTTFLWGSFLGKSIQFTGVESDIVLDFSDPSTKEEVGRLVLEKDRLRALPVVGDIAISWWWSLEQEKQIKLYYKNIQENLKKKVIVPLSKLSQKRQAKKREKIKMEKSLKKHSTLSSEKNAKKIPIDLVKEEAINILKDLKKLNRKR